MFIFTNVLNDVIILLVIWLFIFQIAVPGWKNQKLFPFFRKVAKKTKSQAMKVFGRKPKNMEKGNINWMQ